MFVELLKIHRTAQNSREKVMNVCSIVKKHDPYETTGSISDFFEFSYFVHHNKERKQRLAALQLCLCFKNIQTNFFILRFMFMDKFQSQRNFVYSDREISFTYDPYFSYFMHCND